MPSALQQACAVFGCPQPKPCPIHGHAPKRLGSLYDAEWSRFRLWHRAECFRREVERAGFCGARLPEASPTPDSRCTRHGLLVTARVLDHIQAITGPSDPRRFDPSNVQWLCDSCHNRKRQSERRNT